MRCSRLRLLPAKALGGRWRFWGDVQDPAFETPLVVRPAFETPRPDVRDLVFETARCSRHSVRDTLR